MHNSVQTQKISGSTGLTLFLFCKKKYKNFLLLFVLFASSNDIF